MTLDSVLWIPVINSVLPVGAALGGVWLTHHFTLGREQRLRQAQRDAERYFIVTELVFLVERFAEGCALVATDEGWINEKGIRVSEHKNPTIDFTNVAGDWRALPPDILYKLRELPVLQEEANRRIAEVANADSLPDYDDLFFSLQYQYCKLGLRSVGLARRLRALCALPPTRLVGDEYSAQRVLWRAWREKRRQLKIHAKSQQRYYEALRQLEINQDGSV